MKKVTINTMKKNLVLFFLVAIILIISGIFVNVHKKALALDSGSKDPFIPEQSEIKEYDYYTEHNHINITEFYEVNDDVVTIKNLAATSEQIISIRSASELYYFSYLCHNDNRFLTYNYELLSNIYYGLENYFLPIGNSTPFSGSFEGNGFEIHNLRYLPLNDEMFDDGGLYADQSITYISMFAKSSGKISNFGLVDFELLQNYTLNGIEGVSPVIGYNTGTLENVYVQDLRNPTGSGGIFAIGYQVSGLVCNNQGTINNCYVAYGSVLNYTVADYISFCPIADNNAGMIKNTYFYDESIIDYSNGVYTYNQTYYPDKTATFLNGTYVKDFATMRSKFINIDGWFSKDSYIDSSFDIDLPVRRGFITHEGDDTGKSFNINNVFDFVYLIELANENSYFLSSSVTYYITDDIDFSILPQELFVYNDFVSASFVGVASDNLKLELADGSYSNYPTLYNPYYNNAVEYAGLLCYGMFPLFDGNIQNLNIYYSEEVNSFDAYNSNTPYKAIGLVTGLLEGGLIENVNVFGEINLTTNDNTNNFGGYYVGLLAGVANRKANVNNITTSGSINGGTHNINSLSTNVQSGYVAGNSMGGVIGFTQSTVHGITNVLSNVELNATEFNATTTFNQYVGGVIGSGYSETFNHISNYGTINVGLTNTTSYYGVMNVGGVIGNLFGASNSLYGIHNQGDINVDLNEFNSINISGVMNVDFVTSQTGSLPKSPLNVFYASGISNGANINLTESIDINESNVDLLAINLTYGLFINSSKGFKSEISGLYNLGYKYSGSSKTYLNNIAIDIALIDNFATCLISNATSDDGSIVLDTVYNFRNIDFSATQDIFFNNVLYSGCIIGKYISLTSVYNEGNLDFNISNDAATTLNYQGNNYKKFVVTGVFEEVSQGHYANIVYNDGNINFYLDENVDDFYFNLYISGICYANRVTLTGSDYDVYRIDEAGYDRSKVGSLNQAINNGKIEATSYAIENAVYGGEEKWSANGDIIMGITWRALPFGSTFNELTGDAVGGVEPGTINIDGLLKGMSNISGVCSINEYVITNTFNLGNIFNANYIVDPTGDYDYVNNFEVNSGGLTYANIGEYAQIKDSANNGVVKAINMSYTDKSSANAAGISVRNEMLENGSSYTTANGHSKQYICFTINYGEVYSYNYCDNVTSIEREQHAKSAGIMALGVCSIINTVNYGNIYGSEISSGIFGLVYFEKVASEVNNNNKVIFANSINYGNIWGINKGAMSYLVTNQGDTTKDNQTYQELVDMSFNNQNDYASIDLIGYAKNAYLGALIGVSNFANSDNAQYISIRYLINFCDTIPLVGGEYGIAQSVVPTVDTMVSTYKLIKNGLTTYDKFMNKTVTYAPLSSEAEVINSVSYPGVFNRYFQFRLAVEGEIPATEITDNYISDFFEFVGFTKINDSLLEKIGWRTIAYTTASLEFTKDLEAMGNLMEMYENASATGFSQLIDDALKTESWIGNADATVLPQLIASILEGQDYESLQELIKYLFFTAENKKAITNKMREDVISELLANLDTTNTNKEYLNAILFGNTASYSTLIASAISSNDLEYVAIKEYLISQLNELSDDELEDIARTYITSLNNSTFDSYINDSNVLSARKNLLMMLTKGIDNNILLNIFKNLEIVSDDLLIIAKMELVYEEMTLEERRELFINILASNNNLDDFNQVINEIMDDIDYFNKINEVNNVNYASESEFSNSNNYLEIWNLIRKSDLFVDYLDDLLPTIKDINGNNEKGLYGIATESRNTFQSLDKPAPNGRNSSNISNGTNETLIFNYEPTISPNTYYYGPFSNIGTNRTTANNFPNGVSSWGYKSYSSTFTNIGNQNGNNVYVSTFTSTDPTYMETILGDDTATVAFYYDTNNEQFVSISHFQAFSTTTNTGLLQDFGGTDLIAGNTITLNNNTYVTTENSSVTGFKGTRNSGTWNVYIDGVEYSMTTNATTYANFIMNNAITYYMTSVAQVGIVRYYNPYNTYQASYFTAKSGEGNYVYTTQYIDYKTTDLVKLDGILTGYTEATVQSQDEIDLINFVCNNYLYTTTNKDNTVKLIKKILLESLANDEESVDSFFNTMISNNNLVVNNQTMKDYLVVDQSATSITDYFINNYDGSARNEVVLLGSTNSNNFKYIIDFLLNEEYGYYAYLTSNVFDEILGSLDSIEPEYMIEFLNYLISDVGLTTDEAISILQSLTYSDISTLLSNYPNFDASITDVINFNGNSFSDTLTFSNTWSTTINPIVVNGISYTFGAIANSDNSTITFRSTREGILNIISSDGSGIVLNNTAGTNEGNNTYSWNINANTNYTITCQENVTIYSINTSFTVEELDTNNQGTLISYDDPFIYTTGVNDTVRPYGYNANNDVTYNSYLDVPSGQTITFTMPNIQNYTLVFSGCAATNQSTVTLTNSNGTINSTRWYYRTWNAQYVDNIPRASNNTRARSYYYNGSLTANQEYTLSFSQDMKIYAIGFAQVTNNSYTGLNLSNSNYGIIFDDKFATDVVSISPFKTSSFIKYNNTFYGEDLPAITLNNLETSNFVTVDASGNGSSINLMNGTSVVDTVQLNNTSGTYTFNIPSNGTYKIVPSGFASITDVKIYEYDFNYNASCQIENYFNNEFNEFINQDNSSSVKGEEEVEDYIVNKVISSLGYSNLNINSLTNTGAISNKVTANEFSINGSATESMMINTDSNNLKYLNLTGDGSVSTYNVSFTINQDSYIFVEATGTNLVLNVNGTEYVKPISSTDKYHLFNVTGITSATTCYLYSNATNCYLYDIKVLNSSITSGTLISSFETLYPNFPTVENTITGLEGFDAELFEKAILFDGTSRTEGSYPEDFKALVLFFSATGFDYNNTNSLWDLFTEEDIDTLAKLFGVASDDVLTSYIEDDITLESLEKAIEILVSGDSRITQDILKYLNLDSSTLTDEQKKLLTSLYVATDFAVVTENSQTNEAVTVKDSVLYDIVSTLPTDYRYYNSDGSLDNDKFESLMNELGYNLATTGYGIYALASSQGILNGAFIPDNVVFFKVQYQGTQETHELTEINPFYQLNADNQYELSVERSADWRSEKSNNDEDATDTSSVNYGFKVAMKQLKKSIATTIFDLILVNEDGYELYTVSEYINLEVDDYQGSVTFYVPSNIGDSILNSTFTVYGYEISDKATLDATNKSFKVNDANPQTIRVTAEDTTVYKDYTIYIIKTNDINIDFVSYSVNGGTVSDIITSDVDFKDGSLLANIKTTNIPNLIDLTKYIYIDEYNYESNMFEFITEPIVSATTSDEINWVGADPISGTLNLKISDHLPSGTHNLIIKYSDELQFSFEFTKAVSTENDLISFTFDGEVLEYGTNHNIDTSILFGRSFSYEELTTLVDGVPMYLEAIELSPLAVISSISASINYDLDEEIIDGVYVYKNGIITYEVTYVIMAENNETQTFTHRLIEVDPFESAKDANGFITTNYNRNNYVSIYRDGSVLDLVPNIDGEISTDFRRGENPKYHINYYLDKFYVGENLEIEDYLSVDVNYDESLYNEETLIYQTETKHYGFDANFYDGAEVDVYGFTLVYSASAENIKWDNYEFQRVYNSPTIYIEKLPATNSYLQEITFIKEASKLSNLATIISLDEIIAQYPDETDPLYQRTYEYLKNNPEDDVMSTTTYGISYLTDEAKNANSYYIVGSVSNATLEDFAPLFAVGDHASIYRYITNGTERLLYVEFIDGSGAKEVFLVSEDFTNVYLESDYTTSIATLTDKSFVYNEITYTVSSESGTTSIDNTSLSADFVGAPEENMLWYNDYIVYAEAYDYNTNNTLYREYHVAVIDITNNVYLSFVIDNQSTNGLLTDHYIYFDITTYEAITENNSYVMNEDNCLGMIGVFASKSEIDGMYYGNFSIQAMQFGYYFFTMELPDGTKATYEIIDEGKKNTNNQSSENESYLPPASIITQRISIKITIIDDEDAHEPWGEKFGSIYLHTVERTE